MNRTLRNVLAVLVGIVIGSCVNMGIITIGPAVIPLPEGADISTPEGVREAMKLFTPVNFIVPFLAHAVGTLVGAFVAAKLAASHRWRWAILIGVVFLFGGIMMIKMAGGPLWFCAADLLLAYIPMGYLGGLFAGASRGTNPKQ